MVKKLNKIFILCTALVFLGCTIDYDEEEDVKKSDKIPDSVMVNFHLVKMKDNRPNTEVFATKAEIFNNQDLTILHSIEFNEYNSSGTEVITKGEVKKVEYFNDSKNASLTGGIKFFSEEDDLEIIGDNLTWNDEEKEIESSLDSLIKITKGDGSKIDGYGFKANIKDSTFSFQKGISGYTP